MGLGTPGRWGNLHRWGNKLTLLYMQSYNLLHPGVRFLKIIERSRIMLANHVFWRLMLFYSHLLLLLQPSLLWLFIVTFLNDANPLPNWILREWDVSWIQPQLGGLTHLEIFTWQNLTPGERVTLADWDISLGGSPHISCKHDQIKMNDYMAWGITPPKRVTSPTTSM